MPHAHAHDHHHTDVDWVAMAEQLELQGELHASYVTAALDWLGELEPDRVLDIGSGPGVAAGQLAGHYPTAEVIAVDGSAELLVRAEDRAARLGVTVGTRRADFPGDLAELPEADLIWAANALHHVGDQAGAIAGLAARLRPGGVLAITEGGLSPRYLPREIGIGRPGLQARLDAAATIWFERMRAELPGSVTAVEDWPAMLRAAGLTDVRTRSFLIDRPAPAGPEERRWIRNFLERNLHTAADDLADDDRDTLRRLLDPADPAGIDQRPDVFLLDVKTVHTGRVDR